MPPHNLNAEESLLGALLLSRDVVGQVAELGLQVEHFYKPAHQHIYSAIRGLMTNGNAIDIVTVADELRRNGLLDDIGGAQALNELQNATPAISNAHRYAKIVQDTAVLRKLISVAGEITEIALHGARRRHQGARRGRDQGVRGGRGPRRRLHPPAVGPVADRDGQAAGDVRTRRHHHRRRHRFQRPRRTPVGPAAEHPEHHRCAARDGKVRGLGHPDGRPAHRRDAHRGRGLRRCARRDIDRAALARRPGVVGRDRGESPARRRHQALVPGGDESGSANPHHGATPVALTTRLATARATAGRRLHRRPSDASRLRRPRAPRRRDRPPGAPDR